MVTSENRWWFNRVATRLLAPMLLVIWQIIFSASALAQSGVVAWKEQPFHDNSTAKVYYFERMEKTGPVTWFFRGSQRMGFEPHQEFEMVLLPGSIAELNSKIGSDQLRENFDTISSFVRKYPAAGTLLKKRLEQMESYLKSYESATVKTDAGWMSAAEYDKLIAKSRSLAAAKALAVPPAKPNHRNLVYVVCAVYLLTLLVFTLWRKRTPVLLLLVLPFLAGFGWFTYKDQGFGWLSRVNEELRETYQDLGLPQL